MEIDAIEKFNPWWKTGKVNANLLAKYRRHLFATLKKYIGVRQVVLLYGLRRVGKSTMLYQIISDMLDNVESNNILYFSFDEKKYTIGDVLDTYQKTIKHNTFENMAGRVYVFLDEIQKVDGWEDAIKVYYDLYPNLKFILSGSASIALRKGASESLAGRIYDFVLEPLSFTEFLEMQGKDVEKMKKNPDLWKRDISSSFYKYIKFGSFPELVNMGDEEMAKRYIMNDVIEKIIYRDLPTVFKISDLELLKTLVDLVARSPGAIIDYASLSRSLKRDQRTIANYFEYLEFAMLIRFVFNYRGSPLASKRKSKKAYLSTPNIAFAAGEEISNILPKMLENAAMISTGAKFFYRNSFEVDFILQEKGGLIGVEVKTSIGYKQLMKFKEEFGNKVNGMMLLTADEEGKSRGITAMPLWKYMLLRDK